MKRLDKIPWIVLGTSLFLTMTIWMIVLDAETAIQEKNFNIQAITMTHSIEDKLIQYEEMLIGAKGLFAASKNVEADEWKAYVEVHNLEERFPDIQGVGYAQRVTNSNLDDFINKLDSDGVTKFLIKPEGIRDEYFPVKYIEPFDDRNQRALGYDIYVQETRANAVNIVKNTGETTLTGKITLVQETEKDIQNGFLMLVPVYSKEKTQNSPDSLEGIVYAVARINDFTREIIDLESFEHIHLKIYDDVISKNNLLFDSNEIYENEFTKTDFVEKIIISSYNRDWIFVFEGIQPPLQGINQMTTFLVPGIGFGTSGMLFFALRLFSKFTTKEEEIIQLQEVEKQKQEF